MEVQGKLTEYKIKGRVCCLSRQELTLEQKTPLRVLHRRALAVRQRVIHSMNTRLLDSHHFYLGLKTQAGTYPHIQSAVCPPKKNDSANLSARQNAVKL